MPRNADLMKIVKHHDEVMLLYKQFAEADEAFLRKWEEIAPSNPAYEGFAATILDIYDGQRLVVVDTLEGFVYPLEVVGTITRQCTPRDQLFVRSKRGMVRSLYSMGIVPCADSDQWWTGRVTVVDEFENLDQLVRSLHSEQSESKLEAARSVAEYMRKVYWADFPYVSTDEVLFVIEDDD